MYIMFETETLTFHTGWFGLKAFIRLASSIVSLYLAVKRQQKMLMYRWHIQQQQKKKYINLAYIEQSEAYCGCVLIKPEDTLFARDNESFISLI